VGLLSEQKADDNDNDCQSAERLIFWWGGRNVHFKIENNTKKQIGQ
jgi:hypothetical protein